MVRHCCSKSITRSRSERLARWPAAHGPHGRQHVEALSSALAAFGKSIGAAIETSDQVGDKVTNDIFIEISRGNDKWLWMVEARLSPED